MTDLAFLDAFLPEYRRWLAHRGAERQLPCLSRHRRLRDVDTAGVGHDADTFDGVAGRLATAGEVLGRVHGRLGPSWTGDAGSGASDRLGEVTRETHAVGQRFADAAAVARECRATVERGLADQQRTVEEMFGAIPPLVDSRSPAEVAVISRLARGEGSPEDEVAASDWLRLPAAGAARLARARATEWMTEFERLMHESCVAFDQACDAVEVLVGGDGRTKGAWDVLRDSLRAVGGATLGTAPPENPAGTARDPAPGAAVLGTIPGGDPPSPGLLARTGRRTAKTTPGSAGDQREDRE